MGSGASLAISLSKKRHPGCSYPFAANAKSVEHPAEENVITEKANKARLAGTVVGIVVLILALLFKRILR